MTVPMIRPEDGKTADVHPDEVENWRSFGWIEAASGGIVQPMTIDVRSGEAMTPTDLRAAIKAATGKAPGPRTSREAMIEQFNAIPKGEV